MNNKITDVRPTRNDILLSNNKHIKDYTAE